MTTDSSSPTFWQRLLFDRRRRALEPDGNKLGHTIFNHIVLIFTIGCIFGTYWEEIMNLITNLWTNGEFAWESRRGLVYGPFSPVYGIGAVLIYLIFYLPQFRAWFCFLVGALFGGALEYTLSLLQEEIFGTVSWDYSNLFLNIGGRTTVPYMVVWGLLVVIFARVACPYLSKIYYRIQTRPMNYFCAILAVFLVFDIGMSVAAVLRQTLRHEGVPADNEIEIFLDQRFPDSRLKEIYSNTRAADESNL